MKPDGPMTCPHVSDLLPWLINGTLPDSERQAALLHLERCIGCGRDLEEVRDAGMLFGLHPEPRMLTGYLEGALDAPNSAVVEGHLGACAACSQHLEMARQGLERVRAAGEGGKRIRWWPAMAAAAGVAAGWCLALIWLDAGGLEARLETAELQVRSLNEGNAALESKLRAERGPRVNVTAIDLFPASLIRRSGEPAGTVTLPPAPDSIVLVLNSQTPVEGPYGARLLDSKGNLIWKGEGLLRQRQREFAIQLPPRFLASGDFELRLVQGGSEKVLEVYRFRY